MATKTACPNCGQPQLETLIKHKGRTIWRCKRCWYTYSVPEDGLPAKKDFCGMTSEYRVTKILKGRIQELFERGQLGEIENEGDRIELETNEAGLLKCVKIKAVRSGKS